MKKLQVLCPQEYEASTMKVTSCSRCQQWDNVRTCCSAETGAEHLPEEQPEKMPNCPIQSRCQHQIQTPDGPCVVRRKGLICEAALVYSGMSRHDAMGHPLSFHADLVATPEEIAEVMVEEGAPPEKVSAYLAQWL